MLSKFGCFDGGGALMPTSIFLKCLLFGLVLLVTPHTQAQEVYGKTDVWFLLNVHFDLNEHLSLHNELHLRYDDGLNSKEQFIWRPSVSYKVDKTVGLAGGITYTNTYPYGERPLPSNKPELNLWEQLTLNQRLQRLQISHRYRLEQRFQSGLNPKNGQHDFIDIIYGNRFRYRISLKYLIGQKNYIQIFNELWVNSIGWKNIGFDRNWFYVGLGRIISKKYKVALAYLYQNVKKSNHLFERHPTFQLSWSFGLPFS